MTNIDYQTRALQDPSIRAFHTPPKRRTMPGTYDQVQAAQNAVVDKARELIALDMDAATGKYPAEFIASERLRIVYEARGLDVRTLDAFREYRAESLRKAAEHRAAAEAEVNPTKRLADLTERQMLAASRTEAGDLVRRAAELVQFDQPERAALFLDAARDKGARIDRGLEIAVGDALDKSDSTRAKAREIEDELVSSEATFRTERLKILAISGIGITPQGDAGTSQPGQAALANVEAKTLDYLAKTSRGEKYSMPVGDGSNKEGEA